MQDDERGYERFDLDNEFEGGEWVDGEFVYAREKKRRKMTKDERLYGAFAEDSEGQLEEEADEPDYVSGRVHLDTQYDTKHVFLVHL